MGHCYGTATMPRAIGEAYEKMGDALLPGGEAQQQARDTLARPTVATCPDAICTMSIWRPIWSS